jgi:hypothetical protein
VRFVWFEQKETKVTKNGGISRKERKKAKEIKQEDRPLLFVFFGFFRLKREFMLRFKCGVPVLASIGWGFAALGNPGLEFCGDIRTRAADHRTLKGVLLRSKAEPATTPLVEQARE